jgi:hypothetical protein
MAAVDANVKRIQRNLLPHQPRPWEIAEAEMEYMRQVGEARAARWKAAARFYRALVAALARYSGKRWRSFPEVRNWLARRDID